MADVLSQGEIDGLLTENRQAGGTLTPRLGGGAEVCSRYDFRHPARVSKDQLRTLENLHENFARLLSATLSWAMRAVVEVNTAFVDQTTYAEFIRSLSNPSRSYHFLLAPTNGQAVIDFPPPLVSAFVDRVFGGKGVPEEGETRPLSGIEMGVMARIARRVMFQDLVATWEPILEVDVSDVELETNPEFVQITAASEIVILLAFEVKSEHAKGMVGLCYPFFTLEPLLPHLGRRTYTRRDDLDRKEVVRLNRHRLAGAPVSLSAEIGRGRMTVAALRGLEAGQVLVSRSRASEPCVVFVGDRPKYYARPYTREDGGTGLQVVGRVPTMRHREYLLE